MSMIFPRSTTGRIAFASLSLALSGCAARKGYWAKAPLRFEPVDSLPTWKHGLAYVACPDSALSVQVAFDETDFQYQRFSVLARNNDSVPRGIDPRRFRIIHPIARPDSVDSLRNFIPRSDDAPPDTLRQNAIDPRERLVEVHAKLEEVQAQKNPYRRDNGTFLGALVGGFFEALTAPKNETVEQASARREREDEEQEERRRANEADWDREHRRSIEFLEDEESLWRRQALARTTLNPRESVEGLVVFPMESRLAAAQMRWIIVDTSKAGRALRMRRDSLERNTRFVSRLEVETESTPCVLPFRQVREMPTIPE